MSLCLIGHYGSCNLGDKYQQLGVITNLLKLGVKSEEIICVNFIDYNSKSEEMNIMGQKFNIQSPTAYMKNNQDNRFTLTLVTTGSMDKFNTYTKWLPFFIERSQISIIWGGFTRGTYHINHFKDGLHFLENKNLLYFARSYRDFILYNKITTTNNGFIAGDPLCLWPVPQKQSKTQKKIIITSIYAYKWMPDLWEKLFSLATDVVVIDSVADRPLISKFNDIQCISDPVSLMNFVKDADWIISGRLHGGILSSLTQTPTIMVVTDNSYPDTGSFKFEAVGTHGPGFNHPITSVIMARDLDFALEYGIPIEELFDLKGYKHNIENYISLSYKSLQKIFHLYINENKK